MALRTAWSTRNLPALSAGSSHHKMPQKPSIQVEEAGGTDAPERPRFSTAPLHACPPAAVRTGGTARSERVARLAPRSQSCTDLNRRRIASSQGRKGTAESACSLQLASK
jgi:hypothetical protein